MYKSQHTLKNKQLQPPLPKAKQKLSSNPRQKLSRTGQFMGQPAKKHSKFQQLGRFQRLFHLKNRTKHPKKPQKTNPFLSKILNPAQNRAIQRPLLPSKHLRLEPKLELRKPNQNLGQIRHLGPKIVFLGLPFLSNFSIQLHPANERLSKHQQSPSFTVISQAIPTTKLKLSQKTRPTFLQIAEFLVKFAQKNPIFAKLGPIQKRIPSRKSRIITIPSLPMPKSQHPTPHRLLQPPLHKAKQKLSPIPRPKLRRKNRTLGPNRPKLQQKLQQLGRFPLLHHQKRSKIPKIRQSIPMHTHLNPSKNRAILWTFCKTKHVCLKSGLRFG